LKWCFPARQSSIFDFSSTPMQDIAWRSLAKLGEALFRKKVLVLEKMRKNSNILQNLGIPSILFKKYRKTRKNN
jgi:hypothetical protein